MRTALRWRISSVRSGGAAGHHRLLWIRPFLDGRGTLSQEVLLDKRLLVSDSPKGQLRLGFPIDVVERWFPGLYPVG